MNDTTNLDRDDLFLLMKTYENSVSLNSKILEYQRTLLDQHKCIIEDQKELKFLIENIIEKLKVDIENNKLSDKNMDKMINKLYTKIDEFDKNCKEHCIKLEQDKIMNTNKMSSEHAQIKFRV
jgi:predicted outer membrane protein